MNKKIKSTYINLKNHPGIQKHNVTGRYRARKKIKGKEKKKSFSTLNQARHWRNIYDGNDEVLEILTTATLKEVWTEMQESHFPSLAPSTIAIWHRRFMLLSELEHLSMEKITSARVSKWVEKHVKHFKSDFYEADSRGRAKRCNLNNELNLFVTIFNWYKNSDQFEHQAAHLPNPIKTKHKRAGFIRPRPIKDKAITLADALKFFSYLKPLYRDLAMLQFFTASRIGEIAGLQWSRINFERETLTIMETCYWDMTTKTFISLNPHPKNKEPRPVFMTPELKQILQRRLAHKEEQNDYVFHVNGAPLNYGTIQVNYKSAQKKGRLPYSGTHILRHGMAKLARKIGGGLDAVIAMTGHKDFKLADHYSKLDNEFQKEVSIKIMEYIREYQEPPQEP